MKQKKPKIKQKNENAKDLYVIHYFTKVHYLSSSFDNLHEQTMTWKELVCLALKYGCYYLFTLFNYYTSS